MDNKKDVINVLVVDDEQAICDGFEKILTRIGLHVLKAFRGDVALDILLKENVHIVLLDLKMPGMDGIEVLKRIRDLNDTVLVIMITGHGTINTAIEAMKLGAYDFISKPVDTDHFILIVNRACEKILFMQEAEKNEEVKRRTLADLDAEKSRLRAIIEHFPNGVIITNAKGQVVLMNLLVKQLFNLDPTTKTGQPIESYVTDRGLCNLIQETSQGKHVDFRDIPDYEFVISNNIYLLARGQPILGERNECIGAVTNIVDITAMKVLDQLKSEFVAKVSHELRSPLSTVHEQISLVISDMMEEVSEYDQQILTRAREKTKGLIALIGDLLDLSRIEEGIIGKDPRPVQIEELLESIVEFLRVQAEAKNQSIKLQIPEEPLPILVADPIALESIFGNLITNAINYTQNGGEIKVEADMAGMNMRIKVKDNGFGIADKYFDKIFERFYRVKDKNTRHIIGTGLGLPIVKELVGSMGGLIDLESMPGRGTTFTVLLPIQA